MNKNLKKVCFTFCAPNANPFSASSILSYLKKFLGTIISNLRKLTEEETA